MDFEEEGTPAWLSEATTAALAWAEAEPPEHDWVWWLHSFEGEPLVLRGLDSSGGELALVSDSREFLSEVSEAPRTIHRLPPSSVSPRAVFSRVRAPETTRALAALQRCWVVMLGEPLMPVLIPSGPGFPAHPLSLPTALTLPGPPTPAIAAFATDGSSAAVMLRPLASDPAYASGLLAPGTPAEGVVVDLLARYHGVGSVDPAEMALPWLAFALSGSSGLRPEVLPAGPELPMLSLWLLQLHAALLGSESFTSVLDRIDVLAGFDSWEAIRTDQAGARWLGEWVDREVALNLADPALFATEFLTAVPDPLTALTQLHPLLTSARRRALTARVGNYPGLARWMPAL